MLLLRVVDFSMWLHPLWEIGLTSKGKIIAILHSAKVSKKLLPLPKKRQFRRSTNDKHCSMAWKQYKCFRYGKQSFFCSRIKCATLLHDNAPFALDRVLILNLPIWAKSLRISHGDDSTAKSSAHIVDINALENKRLTSLQHASGISNVWNFMQINDQRSNEPPSMHTHREGRKGHGCLMRTIRSLDISSWCNRKRSSKDFFQLHSFFQEATLMTKTITHAPATTQHLRFEFDQKKS